MKFIIKCFISDIIENSNYKLKHTDCRHIISLRYYNYYYTDDSSKIKFNTFKKITNINKFKFITPVDIINK